MMKSLNLSVTKNLLPASSCNFGEGVKKLALKLKMEDKIKNMSAFQKAIVENVKYLQAHLPLDRKLYANLKFLAPAMKKNENLKTSLCHAAKITKRFVGEEFDNLSHELTIYQVLGDDKVPPFDEDNERLNLWYITVFDVIEKEMNANSTALKKLVKITLALAH